MPNVTVVGGGLAGCETAWQLANRGIGVRLIEMRPIVQTGAHTSGNLAEIVCSNSLKSTLLSTASGLLKAELKILGSQLLPVAFTNSVPAGHALAVDRESFSQSVTSALQGNNLLDIDRSCQKTLDVSLPAVIATGPLTEASLLDALSEHLSTESLYFYDAISPSVDAASIDMSSCFWASRYGKGQPDYLNIPLSETDYENLLNQIRNAELIPAHDFEREKYFEACLPIEVMVARGYDTLRFGPLKPKGLPDPQTGKEAHAIVQLRLEKKDGSLLGLVGFQTRMSRASQKAVIQSIPGLGDARILRFGAIHKNSFINTPKACNPYQMDKKKDGLFYAGQICGVEGYVECIASGMIAALGVTAWLRGRNLPAFPEETLLGALMNYIHTSNRDFQPMNANMGILPSLSSGVRDRRKRKDLLTQRALEAISEYREANSWLFESTE